MVDEPLILNEPAPLSPEPHKSESRRPERRKIGVKAWMFRFLLLIITALVLIVLGLSWNFGEQRLDWGQFETRVSPYWRDTMTPSAPPLPQEAMVRPLPPRPTPMAPQPPMVSPPEMVAPELPSPDAEPVATEAIPVATDDSFLSHLQKMEAQIQELQSSMGNGKFVSEFAQSQHDQRTAMLLSLWQMERQLRRGEKWDDELRQFQLLLEATGTVPQQAVTQEIIKLRELSANRMPSLLGLWQEFQPLASKLANWKDEDTPVWEQVWQSMVRIRRLQNMDPNSNEGLVQQVQLALEAQDAGQALIPAQQLAAKYVASDSDMMGSYRNWVKEVRDYHRAEESIAQLQQLLFASNLQGKP